MPSTPEAVPSQPRSTDVRWRTAIGLALAALALVVYGLSNPHRYNFYAHFTWQAQAWLEGEAGIRWPVCSPFHPAPDCIEYAPETPRTTSTTATCCRSRTPTAIRPGAH